MRIAVVDIGTNSTRLLVADVDSDGGVSELERRSQVTRLGAGVDATGALADDAMLRVFSTLEGYRELMLPHDPEARIAVLTSAVRDASNGGGFLATVRERFDLDARTVDGDEEARLTFLGATSERPDDGRTELLVIDIGGGSTELVCGRGREVGFHVSTQAGVVRQTERFLSHDPPAHDELTRLAEEIRTIFAGAVPTARRRAVGDGIAVAGTATSCAAIALELDPYDPERVEGFRLELSTVELLSARLAAMPLRERRNVVGLHPDRAPTIVAGVVILEEAMRAFDLHAVTISEHDILRGAALRAAAS